ncbi:hypothetical protein POREN0001_1082 [Porphyromonas endodontalis ATCC 35406]|uniref:Uncharacterized protein n=1 Tax=Porphyromonas endodontalis (strain ATCC 35406 / DSM 24491 / JCM 8526 / CCUG 16442 / BCRC 14492 / NCTC 13058 / HG 370) TaxID=553175 RepID=C3J9D9_POREA|nr:hypothetical protein POREN0001_1082 [Porphyromonas endodontalis ATCC 35406]
MLENSPARGGKLAPLKIEREGGSRTSSLFSITIALLLSPQKRKITT